MRDGPHGLWVPACSAGPVSLAEPRARVADFVRDNDNAGGAFCVAPASHKASLPVPEEYVRNPDLDPSMVGLEVKAGDVSRPQPSPRNHRP